MTEKDFELIARAFSQFIEDELLLSEKYGKDVLVKNLLYNFAQRLASQLANTNPRFNRQKFLEACGVYA